MDNLDLSRMMHYGQIGCSAYGLGASGTGAGSAPGGLAPTTATNLQTSTTGGPGGPGGDAIQQPGDLGEGIRGHADINSILNQIMNITDQSLDEAQVFQILFPKCSST